MIRILPAFDVNSVCEDGPQAEIFGGVRAGHRQPTVHHAARMGAQGSRAGANRMPAAASRPPL
jgi:hypothetical protein